MTNDGTQDPVPPPVLSDPLAGLVTGTRYEPDTLRVRVTNTPLPDISAVREAMASVLDEDSELVLGSIGPAEAYFTDSSDGDAPAAPAPDAPATPGQPAAEAPAEAPPADQPAAAPPVPTRGPVTRVPTPPRGIPAPRMPGEKTRKVTLARRKPKLPPRVKGKEHSSAGSVTLIMVLLVVMAVLGIVFLASFIGSVASLFD
jgi:hypothetical protein